jgi:hypothetical protein
MWPFTQRFKGEKKIKTITTGDLDLYIERNYIDPDRIINLDYKNNILTYWYYAIPFNT